MMCILSAAGNTNPPIKQTQRREPFAITKFDFDWFVVESGEAKLVVNKTQDVTRIILRGGGMMGDWLWLLPEDAIAVGAALEDVDVFYAKMRNSQSDASNTTDAGNCTVTFRFFKEYGFSVGIKKKGQYNSLSLDRSAAKAFAPHLQKAKEMVAYLDDKLNF
jgi:hypothetical protein